MNQLIKIGENFLLLTDGTATEEMVLKVKMAWQSQFPGIGLAVMPGTKFINIAKIEAEIREQLDGEE